MKDNSMLDYKELIIQFYIHSQLYFLIKKKKKKKKKKK